MPLPLAVADDTLNDDKVIALDDVTKPLKSGGVNVNAPVVLL